MHWTLQTPGSNKLLVGSRHRGKRQVSSLFLELLRQCYGFKQTALKRTGSPLRACSQSGVPLAPCRVRDDMQGLNSADVDSSALGKSEGLPLAVSEVLVSQCLPCLHYLRGVSTGAGITGQQPEHTKPLLVLMMGDVGVMKKRPECLSMEALGSRDKYAGDVQCMLLGRLAYSWRL